MLKRKSFVIVDGAAITVGRADAVKNVIMLRTSQMLLHFLLEELGSVGCYATTSTEIFNSSSHNSFARRNIGRIVLADGFR